MGIAQFGMVPYQVVFARRSRNACVGRTVLPSARRGQYFVTCTGIPTLADVTPIGFTDGLTGWSAVTSPVTVVRHPAHLGLDVRFSAGAPVSQVEAGQPVEVEITVSDIYGNMLMGSALDGIAAGLTWSGVQESPDCTRLSSPVGASGVPEVLVYECMLTRAEVGHNIQAHYSGITGFSTVFDVVPGPLESVSVDLLTDTSTFVAGDVMEVLLTAYDAFGNHLVSPVPNGIDASTDPESQTQRPDYRFGRKNQYGVRFDYFRDNARCGQLFWR